MNHGMLSLIFSAILAAIALAAPLTPLDADSATKSSEPVQKAILSEWLGAFVSVAPSGDVTADAHYGKLFI